VVGVDLSGLSIYDLVGPVCLSNRVGHVACFRLGNVEVRGYWNVRLRVGKAPLDRRWFPASQGRTHRDCFAPAPQQCTVDAWSRPDPTPRAP
jgi:hypothetical protein